MGNLSMSLKPFESSSATDDLNNIEGKPNEVHIDMDERKSNNKKDTAADTSDNDDDNSDDSSSSSSSSGSGSTSSSRSIGGASTNMNIQRTMSPSVSKGPPSTVIIAKSLQNTNRQQRNLMGAETNTPGASLGYPVELEQSDEFKTLLSGGQDIYPDFEFMTTDVLKMDQYVRQTMHMLLKWLSTLKKSNNRSVSRSGHKVTMVDLSLYCKYFPKDFQQAYTLRVERILNSNGLSLQLGASHEFDPDTLASLFVPIFRPTILKCDCFDKACELQNSNDPSDPRYCACKIAERECTSQCNCNPYCKNRPENKTMNREASKSRVDISGVRNASVVLNPVLNDSTPNNL